MGIAPCVYVGPYVACRPRDRYEEVTRPVRKCTGAYCNSSRPPTDAKFCKHCGSPIAVANKIVQQRIELSVFDVIGEEMLELGDLEGPEDLICLAPNLANGYTPRPFRIDCKYDEPGYQDLTTLDPKQEMEWLAVTYEQTLSDLRKEFDDVKICWGVHHYYQ